LGPDLGSLIRPIKIEGLPLEIEKSRLKSRNQIRRLAAKYDNAGVFREIIEGATFPH
jgi:hypothetical protein